MVAMLNRSGAGTLFFGVKDNGDVLGQGVSDKTLREVSQTIRVRVFPAIYPTINKVNVQGKTCIRVDVQGTDVSYSSAGVYYMRVHDEGVQMTRDMLADMLRRKDAEVHPWDSEPSRRSLADVDEDELRRYVRHGNEKGRISFEYDSAKAVLERLGLFKDGHLLNAGEVCFCPSELPMLQMAVFATERKITFLDNQRVEGTLFQMVRRAEMYVAQNTHRRFEFTGALEREEIPEIPFEAVREALLNAFCHRDYLVSSNVQVDILKDRVEIFSPGCLPVDMDLEKHLSQEEIYSRSRNKLLATTLYRSGDIESYGSGLPRIRRLCEEAGIDFDVKQVSQGTVIVFWRPDWEREFAEKERAQAERIESGAAFPRASLGDNLPPHAEEVLRYLDDMSSASTSDVARVIGLSNPQTRKILSSLASLGVIRIEGASRSTRYRIAR